MSDISTGDARKHLAELVNRVAYGTERYVASLLTRLLILSQEVKALRFLHPGRSGSVALPVFAGLVALLLAPLCAPVPASCQEPEGDTTSALRAWPSSIRETPLLRSHTMIGLATGVTVASVAVPLSLGASTCFGSGNYLQLCRVAFVAGAAVGGGLGALVGRKVRTDGPPGRATTIMIGSALGAVGAFLVSLPVCGQEEADNPELLCGYDGMIEPEAVLGAAVVGGILGYLLRGRSESLGVSQLGPVPTPDGRSALAVAFTISR